MPTELAATILIDEIRQHIDKGEVVGAKFIDLSKAFDTISHSNLLQKLPQYGICDEELVWFADYLLIDQWLLAMVAVCLTSKIFKQECRKDQFWVPYFS